MFIYRCTWQGVDCNITTDFRTVLTDLGVCYTFNNKQTNMIKSLTVTEAGENVVTSRYNLVSICINKVLKFVT